MFQEASGNWTDYRRFSNLVEIDFHYSDEGRRSISYSEAMESVRETALNGLTRAYEEGNQFVLFVHGSSTSRLGEDRAFRGPGAHEKQGSDALYRPVQVHSTWDSVCRGDPVETLGGAMPKNVQSIIDDLESGLAELRMHLESLGSIVGGSAKTSPAGRKSAALRRRVRRAKRVPTGIPAAQRSGVKKARRKMKMSPALRKQRQLQGRYMGLVRRLPKANRLR